MSGTSIVLAIMPAASLAAMTSDSDVWRLTGFLLFGAVLGVVWCCWSKQAKEENRMTRARILAGIVGGVGIPRLIALLPWKLNLEQTDPIIIGLLGFLFSVFGFYVMHAFLRKIETRQNPVAGMLMKTLEKRMSVATGEDVKEDENGSDKTAASGAEPPTNS